ncbi:MAG: extracellular solute-binding protein [Phycisphaerae bacterium]
MRLTGPILVTAALAALVLMATRCRSTSGPATRQVVLFCSVDQPVAEPIIAAFERQTGIKVLARYDQEAAKTVGLVQRIRAEKDRPSADVFWSSEVFHTILLAREGLLASYKPKQDWPAQYRGQADTWFGFALRQRVMAYSTTRVAPDQAPKRLEDLLEARWKGRVVMARPQFGTTGGDVASWFAHYGREKARSILRGLCDNGVQMVEGNSVAVRMVTTGQADVALTDNDDFFAYQASGAKIAMVPLDQGGDGALVIPNSAAIVKGAPHRAEAEELMAFLLGGKAEQLLAESVSHNTPLVAKPPAGFEKYAIGKGLQVDYQKVADELPGALEAAREILK